MDVSPFQSVAMVPAKGKLCHVSDVHEELATNSILDETQRQAVNLVLNQRLAIIQVNASDINCLMWVNQGILSTVDSIVLQCALWTMHALTSIKYSSTHTQFYHAACTKSPSITV